MTDQTLSLSDITFSYGKTQVLHDISARFSPGRLTAICGPNGCGKSTLLNVAAAQLCADAGTVTLAGQPLATMPPKDRAKRLAMLPQSPHAPPELRVYDLVALGRFAHRSALSGLSQGDKTAIASALDATNMTAFADRPLAALSGGQKQRAWIAMTLAQTAPWLLLDEPTNHLDVTHAIETMELLRALVDRDGKTAIVVLHDLNLMARFADDVVLMEQGRILAQDQFSTAVDETRLSGLYRRPVRFGAMKGRDRPFIVVD